MKRVVFRHESGLMQIVGVLGTENGHLLPSMLEGIQIDDQHLKVRLDRVEPHYVVYRRAPVEDDDAA